MLVDGMVNLVPSLVSLVDQVVNLVSSSVEPLTKVVDPVPSSINPTFHLKSETQVTDPVPVIGQSHPSSEECQRGQSHSSSDECQSGCSGPFIGQSG
jgi:hypothetical protein